MISLAVRYTLAFVGGICLVFALRWLAAGIWALPGLSSLIKGVAGWGIPLEPTFHLFLTYLPRLLLAFLVGTVVFKIVRGHRGGLLLATCLPWLLTAINFHIEFCVGTDVPCYTYFLFHVAAGFLDVPIGLALAAFISQPPNSSLSFSSASTVLSGTSGDLGTERKNITPFEVH